MSDLVDQEKDNTTIVENVVENVVEEVNTFVENVVENVVEEVTTVVENAVEQLSLANLVKNSLDNENIKNAVNSHTLMIINNIIISSPKTLDDIEKACNEVIKDGRIDSNDIPTLIIIIQRIYQITNSLRGLNINSFKQAKVTADTLKLIIQILVSEKKIIIEDGKKQEVLNQMDSLIDSCVSLLTYKNTIKPKGCLARLFSKK